MAETTEIIPLVEERLVIQKRSTQTRIRVHVSTQTNEETVESTLLHTDVVVDRVPVGRAVEAAPPIREENGVTIVPVLEEIVVVTKQLFLKEELHIRRASRTETVSETVTLRRQDVTIERLPPP